jgi:hypothetical protein
MLQFNKSETTNTNAVWIETVNTGSGYYDSLALIYSQSYDNSNGQFNLTTTSAPNVYRHWLIVSNAGVLAPDYSGQYDVEIWTIAGVQDAVWNQVATAWASFDTTWANAQESAGGLGEKIYEDRAFVSGSNESSITQYLSPDENGTYITYNG